MRVISQNGRIELPYENTVISISELSSDIYAYVSGNCEVPQDAMKQLKEMSKRGFGILTIKDCEQNVTFEPMNICFRFPQEDELC